MGIFRKVESGIEKAFGGVFGRTFKENVEPVELASKLVHEMEQRKVASVSRVYVPNQYTIFLCVDDRKNLRSYESALSEELEAHVAQHARTQGYTMVGPSVVSFKTDTDLRLGQFGVLAEMVEAEAAPPPAGEPDMDLSPGEEALAEPSSMEPPPSEPSPAEPPAFDWRPQGGSEEGRSELEWESEEPAASEDDASPGAEPESPETESPETESPEPESPEPESPEPESPEPPRAPPPLLPLGPKDLETRDIPVNVATELNLARHTIILEQGPRAAEFHKGRVVLGRAKSADFQLDDLNVSRRHAAVYWEQGGLYVKDLGSTNGTLLNGKPVTAGPISPGDVITLGDTDVTVRTG